MKYRAEIDGLRALAVIPVILFHAGLELFSGGFVGVDMFFVISGYLITTIIVEDIKSNRFSIGNFYERRIRRIIPPLYLMMLFVFTWAFLFWSPYDTRNVAQSIVATTIFSNNLLLAFEGDDYFNMLSLSIDVNPLLHTWSLAVEEQFYFIYPLLLLILFGPQRWLFLSIITGLFISSFYFGLVHNGDSNIGFYMPHYRAWEFLVGAIAYYIYPKLINIDYKRVKSLASLIGLMMIAWSVVNLSENTSSQPYLTLIPTLGTFLVICATGYQNLASRILSHKSLVFIGLISYSLYLWHQPIISILEYNLLAKPDAALNLSVYEIFWAIFITFFLSFLSYYYVERLFRDGQRISRKFLYSSFILFSLMLLSTGIVGHTSYGYLKTKLPRSDVSYINQNIEKNAVIFSQWGQIQNPKSSVLIIGDSVSNDLQMSLIEVGIDADRFKLDGLCFKLIVETGTCDGVKLGDVLERVSGKSIVILATNIISEDSIEGYQALSILLRNYTNVYALSGFEFGKPTNVSYAAIVDSQNPELLFYSVLDSRIETFERALESALGEAYVINKKDFFCDERTQACSLYNNNGIPLFYDGIHLTKTGWKYFGDKVKEWALQSKKSDSFFGEASITDNL